MDNNFTVFNFAHMSINVRQTELDFEIFRQWQTFFKHIESESKQYGLKEPIIESFPLSPDKAISVLVTGKDMFLSVYDNTTKELSSYCNFEDVKYFSSKNADQLLKRIHGILDNKIPYRPTHLASLWGKQMVARLAKEDTFEGKQKLVKLQYEMTRLAKSADINISNYKKGIETYVKNQRMFSACR